MRILSCVFYSLDYCLDVKIDLIVPEVCIIQLVRESDGHLLLSLISKCRSQQHEGSPPLSIVPTTRGGLEIHAALASPVPAS